MTPRPIALLVMNLGVGGAQRAMSLLAREAVAQGREVVLAAGRLEGPYLETLPPAVKLIELSRKPVSIAARLKAFADANPDAVLLSAQTRLSVIAGGMKRLGLIKNPLVVREPNRLVGKFQGVGDRIWASAIPFGYTAADRFIAVSGAIGDDLQTVANVPRERIEVIPNAVDTRFVSGRAGAPVPHPWLTDDRDTPVVLAAGRLAEQKGFDTLLKAFAQAKQNLALRLIILGEGKLREELEALARQLGVSDDVSLPGFVDNPYAFMSRADLFVLSSRFEGSPNVMLEALACDCQVVSTDCPSGPREILAGVDWGRLVPVDDVSALSASIENALAHPLEPGVCRQFVEERHDVSAWADRYLRFVDARH